MIKLHPPKLSKNTVKEASKILKTNWLSTSGKNISIWKNNFQISIKQNTAVQL